jgi:pyrroline-5-carboxylate reductase
MLVEKTIGIIGAGVMAEVLTAGLLRRGQVQPEDIIVSHYRSERLEEFRRTAPVRTTLSNAEAYRQADIPIICVQPFAVGNVLHDLRPVIEDGRLLCSIVAAMPIEFYRKELGTEMPFVRAMPTFYGRSGIGTTAIALNDLVTADQLANVIEIFGTISEQVAVMPEWEMNAFTSFSSTAAALIYMLLDALFTAGSLVGLRHQMTHARALEQVIAAARNVMATEKLPSQLQDEICTPGGVTVEGVKVLEERAVRGAVIDGVLAAAKRAETLSQGVG